MPVPVLHIGNKNYSSWSLRAWLALKWGGIPFEEKLVALGGEGYGRGEIREVRAVSPTGRVPALHLADTVIYESLAICEWAAEQTPSLWPADPMVRAEARSASCEMHAGFVALRMAMSCNIRRRLEREPKWNEAARADLARLYELWGGLRARYGGEGQRAIDMRERWTLTADTAIVFAPAPRRPDKPFDPWAERSCLNAWGF